MYLKQVGAVSSADRFVTEKAKLQKQKNIYLQSALQSDNFDMMSPHAAVYCGAVQRSYHGTTVQVVQHNPLLNLNHRCVTTMT